MKKDVIGFIEQNKDELIKLVEEGATYLDICAFIGCGKSTFYNALRDSEKGPEILAMLERARRKPVRMVHNAVLKSALGYDVTKTKTVTTIDKDGNEITTITTTTEHIPPNSKSAQIYLLSHDKEYRTNDVEDRHNKKVELDIKKQELEIKKQKSESEAW